MISHEVAVLGAGWRRIADSGFALRGVMATLVETRGPVFRRAGARMLVLSDGSIVRGLSAGCPEADIAERAREVLNTGTARLLRYDREHGYDALLELGCGGEMQVLLEPLTQPEHLQHLALVEHQLGARRNVLLMTVFSENGRCLPTPQRLVWSEDWLLDERRDPALAASLLALAPRLRLTAVAQLAPMESASGTLQVLFEQLQPPLRLIILGVNTTAIALSHFATRLGWQVEVVDHRDDSEAPALSPSATLVRAAPRVLRQRLAFDPRTAVIAMTHNLERDLEYLQRVAAEPLVYIGAIGSRTRAAKMRQALSSLRMPLHSPAGLDIGSETPEEIALAVAAEIQAVLSGHVGGALCGGEGPIH